jgi:hypothetical protein
MTSFRQFEANRRNALRSTGPTSEEGKRRSRRNAVRHGLTAETVLASLEDAEDYKAFEAAVIADYDGQTAVERELVLRLASLLWRLRRATAIETQLLEIQANALTQGGHRLDDRPPGQATSYCSVHHLPRPPPHDAFPGGLEHRAGPGFEANCEQDRALDSFNDLAGSARSLAHCFMHLANIDNGVFERLNRYESSLWRQTVQTVLTIGSVVPRLHRRYPRF